jgi:uroporphyrinogen-III synthase
MATEPGVLVTRPAGQGKALCQALAAAGFRPLQQPLLQLEALPALAPGVRQHLLELDKYQHIIFISANAVHFGLACIDDYWPQLPLGLNWYAIGSATAALLAERGLAPLSPATEMTSEGLLARPELQQVAGQRVLIVKGEGGRDTLRRELSARGARVDELACYRRRCPELAAGELARKVTAADVKFILLSSGEGLANLLALLSEKETTKFRDMCLVVPSGRVARMAQEAGFSRVATADNASDEAMLRALQEYSAGD